MTQRAIYGTILIEDPDAMPGEPFLEAAGRYAGVYRWAAGMLVLVAAPIGRDPYEL